MVIVRESDGRWYVTFTVDAAEPGPLPKTEHAVGVDLGVKDFAVTSDTQRIANPRHLERRARNLARYQRRLARDNDIIVTRGSPSDACGGDIRHSGTSRVQSPAKQEPQSARAGIPVLQGGE